MQEILAQTTDKLKFLEATTPDALQRREELSKFVGDEISRIINEQRTLERRYETLILERTLLKGSANKMKYKEVQKEIRALSQALRITTKNLCRNLQDNPNVAGNLLKIQRERKALICIVEKTHSEVKDTD